MEQDVACPSDAAGPGDSLRQPGPSVPHGALAVGSTLAVGVCMWLTRLLMSFYSYLIWHKVEIYPC